MASGSALGILEPYSTLQLFSLLQRFYGFQAQGTALSNDQVTLGQVEQWLTSEPYFMNNKEEKEKYILLVSRIVDEMQRLNVSQFDVIFADAIRTGQMSQFTTQIQSMHNFHVKFGNTYSYKL